MIIRKKKRLTCENKIDILAELAWHHVERPTLEEMKLIIIDLYGITGAKPFVHFLEKYGLAEIFGRCRRHPNSPKCGWVVERFEFETHDFSCVGEPKKRIEGC